MTCTAVQPPTGLRPPILAILSRPLMSCNLRYGYFSLRDVSMSTSSSTPYGWRRSGVNTGTWETDWKGPFVENGMSLFQISPLYSVNIHVSALVYFTLFTKHSHTQHQILETVWGAFFLHMNHAQSRNIQFASFSWSLSSLVRPAWIHLFARAPCMGVHMGRFHVSLAFG